MIAVRSKFCRPAFRAKLIVYSAMYYHDPSTLVHATYASRTIHPGEEITITCMISLSIDKAIFLMLV